MAGYRKQSSSLYITSHYIDRVSIRTIQFRGMERKYIVFVVFASLTRGSFALSSTYSYGLPESAMPGLVGIIENQNAAVDSRFAAFGPIFDILQKYAAQLIHNLSATSNDESATLTMAQARAYDVVDYSVNSVLIVAGGPCDAAEVARSAGYRYLEDVFTAVPQAIALARSSNYSESQMEKLRIQARDDLVGVLQNLASSTNICLKITSPDGLVVSEDALDYSRQGLIDLANAIFNAIRLYAAAYAAGSADLSLISKIEYYRSAALNGLKTDVANNFGALRATYMNFFQNETGLIDGMYEIQYTQIVSTFKYSEGFEAIFSTINDSLSTAVLGVSDVGTDDFNPEDFAYDVTNAKWRAATNQICASVLSIFPNDFSTIKDIGDELLQIALQMANIFYDQVDIAKTPTANISDTMARIETMNSEANSQGEKYIQTIFELFRINGTLADKIKDELMNLQTDGIAQMEIWGDGIYNASVILAIATSETEDTSADELFTPVGYFQREIISATWNVANIVSVAAMVVLQASNEDYTGIQPEFICLHKVN